MRMLRFRTALTDFLRRWGVYFAIVVLLFSAGSNAPVTIAAALAGTLVWPLRLAAAHGAALIPTTLAYAALGTLPVMLTRPLWWPRRWASAEHALPLAGDVIRRSDRLFALLMMTPWQAVLLIGGIGAWLNDDAGHAAADRWWALGGWTVSMLGSLQLSLLWMRAVRRMAATGHAGPVVIARRRVRGGPRHTTRRLGACRTLILLPMLRRRAQRSALALVAGSLATIACTVVPHWAGLSLAWAFGFAAVAVMCATSVLRTSTVRELRPLWQDNRYLPLNARTCERARLVVTLLPLVAGAFACFVVAALTASPVRPQVGVLYGMVVGAGCVLEAFTPPAMSPSDHAARWSLMLVAAIAFASEISP